MSEFKVLRYADEPLEDPIAVVGFPNVGLVGWIVSSYLARTLGLHVAAAVDSTELPPYAFVQEGRCYPPVRIYAGQLPRKRRKPAKKAADGTEGSASEAPAAAAVKKRTSRKKRDIVIVTSEIAPRPEHTGCICDSILEALDSLGVEEIVCVDGIPRISPDQTELLGLGSTDSARKRMEDSGLKLMKDGIVRGVSGVMLFKGEQQGREVECVLSPANPQLPDPRAASWLLGPLSALIPGLDVDPSPLTNEANEIDGRIKAQMQQQTINHSIYG